MNFRFEQQKVKDGFAHIIGCDEVGRGCLAGPVVAAAVVFPAANLNHKSYISRLQSPEASANGGQVNLREVKDSKLLSSETREELSVIIKQHALWSIGVVSQKVIDEINIHNATLLAMKRAVEGLFVSVIPSAFGGSDALARDDKVILAVDGKFAIPDLNIPQQAVVGGDNKILSIAAASIVAKVYRDELMRKMHEDYPMYNFAQHKGYGTEYHREAIVKHGLTPLHRMSFCSHLISS